jgi:trimeric autotransporter adhesin
MESIHCLLKMVIHLLNRSACVFIGTCVTMLLISSGSAYSQEILKDINPGYMSYDWEYLEAIDRDGTLFFISNAELWRTNGTTIGTIKIRDFDRIQSLTNVDGVIYFVAQNATQRKWELWKTNGASYSTIKLKDIGPISSEYGIGPRNLLAVGNRLYFVTDDGVSGWELWTSDGTAAGTRIVKDILKGGSSNPSWLAASNGIVYFAANDGINGYELWKSDGTAGGTAMVKDIRPGRRVSSSPQLMTEVNGMIFFSAVDSVAGRELWKSNGTAAGTTMVREIIPGSGNTMIRNLTNVNGTLFFSASDGVHGPGLWKSNGTAAGTYMVKGSLPRAGSFTNLNGVLYFTANYHFWKSDGTEAGTINLGVMNPIGYGTFDPHYVYMNGYVYFFDGGNEGRVYGAKLMREDGHGNVSIVTSAILSDDYTDYPPFLVKSKNVLYFHARPNLTDGHALFKTNGTVAGTQLVADTYRPQKPNDFAKIGNTLYFISHATANESLWKTDGTGAGTFLVTGMRYIDELITMNGVLYFAGGVQKPDGFFWDIYLTDGTPAGTVPMNFKGGKNTLPIQKLTIMQNKIFFVNNYTELWSFNAPSFTFLSEIIYPNKLAACGDKLYFYAANSLNSGELWKSNGTPAGTAMVKDINPNGSSAIDKLSCLNTTLFFSANDGVHGHEVWRSNGTSGGTLLVKDVRPADATNANLNDIDLLASNGAIYFTSKNTTTSSTLWKSNGTAGGTTFLGNVGIPVRLMDGLQRIYFVSNNDGVHNLWKSEGTPETTQILMQFYYNPYATSEPSYTTVNNIFYGGFTINLVVSDGTACGSSMGSGQSPYPVTSLGERIIFGGWDFSYGYEVFTANIADLPMGCSVSAQATSGATLIENELVSLYPNPFHDYVSVSVKGDSHNKDYSARIIDVNGKQIEFHEKLQYDIANPIGTDVPAGMYLLEIAEGEKTTIRKVIKN